MSTSVVSHAALLAVALLLGAAGAANAAPVLTFIEKPPPRTNSGAASILLASSEPVTWSNCSLTNWFPGSTPSCGGPTTDVYSAAFSVPQPGEHTFSITATSIADGTSTTASTTWVRDTDPPDTHIDSGPRGGAAITGSEATWTFGASGIGSGDSATFECSLDDGDWTACTNPHQRTGLTDGEHTFSVRAVDQAGNPDPSPATASFSVNNGPPEASIWSVAGHAWEAGQPVYTALSLPTWELSLSRPDAVAECSLDGSEFADCGFSFTPPAELPDGEHSFRVRAKLAGGAVQDPPVESVVVVDTLAPGLSFVSAPPAHVAGSSVTFAYGADESGVSFRCSLDDGPLQDPCPTTFTGLSAGDHVLELFGSDRTFNDAPAITRRWRNHLTPPDTTLTGYPDPGVEVAVAAFSFSSKPGNTFECRVDSGGWEPCASPLTLAGLGGGEHTLSVRAVDPAGQRDPSPAVARWRQTPPPAPAEPPAPPAQAAPPAHAAVSARLLRAGATKVTARRGRYTVTTGFAAACATTSPSPCVVSATLRDARGRKARLGKATIRVRPGHRRAIRIELTKSISKRLSRTRRTTATLVVRLPGRSEARRTIKLRVR
jgi:large repetitive protein